MPLEISQPIASPVDFSSMTRPGVVWDTPHWTIAGSGLGGASRSLLFIDQSVADYQQLVAAATPGTEVHILNSTQDAVAQITQTLLGREGISSLHIVSHGEAGGLNFGGDRLNLGDLPGYAAQLQSWSQSLTEDADILLYGCNVASGELGQAFVQILSQLTGADVAASDDLTGSAVLGGDWDLEFQTSSIETELAFSAAATLGYGNLLNDAVYANAQQFISGNVTAQKIFTDGVGNVYTTGSFSGTVDFDPGAGIVNLTSAGSSDVFISKLDSNGNYLWAKQLGGSDYDSASDIGVDSTGNVYTTGYFRDTADFNPGVGTANLTHVDRFGLYRFGIFVSKLDSSGNYLWAKQLGGNGSSFETNLTVDSLTLDSVGNVYTTGRFQGTDDFDPGEPVVYLTSVERSTDVFISKLDSNGNYLWVKQLGGSGNEFAADISVDSTGNVYTTGSFQGTVNFNPGAGTANLLSAAGSLDDFISKLDSNGNYLWAKQFIGADSNSRSISVDSTGNVYTAGRFYGTVDFNPGSGTANLTSAGGSDVVISKLDSNGNYLWAKQLGGSNYDYASDISVDSTGNVYTTGSFYGTVDFDPGAGIANLTNTGDAGLFISKLDSSGNYLWAKQLGVSNYNYPRNISVSVDRVGNVYTTGKFEGTADFDPGAGTVLLTGGASSSFISKLDSSGNYKLAQQFSSGSTTTQVISTDSAGNVYTTGSFYGTVDFDPGAGIANLTSAGADVFVSKLDSRGNYLWAKQLGSNGYDAANGITVDSAGNVYTTGLFSGTGDFDPGVGIANLTSAGSVDIFVSKLDSNGNFLWAKQFSGLGDDGGTGVSVDDEGNVYTTGFFQQTVDFDPGAGVVNLTSAGISDVFVSKLDSSGNYLWAKRFGGTGDDVAHMLAVDSVGTVYLTGRFEDTVDFDPGAGIANLTSAGGADVFISKLDSRGNYLWARRFGGTANDRANGISIDSNGGVYTTGAFRGTVDFNPGVGVAELTSLGTADIFISKLDGNGNYLWARQFSGENQANDISVDRVGNVYTTGRFRGTVDFNPGAGIATLTSFGDADIFVSKLDSGGNYLWAKQLGGTGADEAIDIEVDRAGNVYTTGGFGGTADFDPSAGIVNLFTGGTTNSFISKLSQGSTNLDPILTLSSTALSYLAPATLIDPNASVTDLDSANFATGVLLVNYLAGSTTDDRLFIRNQGIGAGQIGVSGTTVTYGGRAIGTIGSNGSGTAPLAITFNSIATPAAVSALLKNLTYANVSATPSTPARTIRVVLTDGFGGVSNTVTKTINVVAINDAPSFTKGADQTTVSGAGTQTVANWATNFVPGPSDESSQTVQQYQIVSNSNPGLFSVQPTIAPNGTLTYTPVSTIGAAQTATIVIQVKDNGGTANGGIDTSAPQSFTITVNPAATPPVFPPTPAVSPIFTMSQLQQTLLLSQSIQDLIATQPPGLPQLFDEEYYLNQNPDVYTAVAKGMFQSGFQHFLVYGQYEGRNPSGLYNEQYYLSQNADVAAAVARGNFRSGLQHFLSYGQFEGRNPSTLFNEQSYLAQNPDVAAAVARGNFRSGLQHFLQHGFTEGRLSQLTLFNESYYLSQNPDVAAAVAQGAFKNGLQHFELYGQREGRQPSSLFDERYYLSQNPDVAAAVARGQFKSGFDHYLDFGRFEGRRGVG